MVLRFVSVTNSLHTLRPRWRIGISWTIIPFWVKGMNLNNSPSFSGQRSMTFVACDEAGAAWWPRRSLGDLGHPHHWTINPIG
jgi:hypothetical protein